MHILLGAIVGMVVSVGLTFVASRVINRPLGWKDIAASAMAGIIGGSIASATLGVGAASTLRTVAAFSAGGATGSAGGQITDNVLHGHPVHKDVGKATAFGTAVGAGTLGVGKALAPVAKHVPKLLGITRAPATATSGGGHGGNSLMAGFAAGLDDAVVPVTRYVQKALAEDPVGEEATAAPESAHDPPAQVVEDKEGALGSLEQALDDGVAPEAQGEAPSSAWIERLRK